MNADVCRALPTGALCRTNIVNYADVGSGTVRERTGMECVNTKASSGCGPVTKGIDNIDLCAVRTRSKLICVRHTGSDGKNDTAVTDLHIWRTVIEKVKDSGMDGESMPGGVRVQCIKVGRLGMFHNRLTLKAEMCPDEEEEGIIVLFPCKGWV